MSARTPRRKAIHAIRGIDAWTTKSSMNPVVRHGCCNGLGSGAAVALSLLLEPGRANVQTPGGFSTSTVITGLHPTPNKRLSTCVDAVFESRP